MGAYFVMPDTIPKFDDYVKSAAAPRGREKFTPPNSWSLGQSNKVKDFYRSTFNQDLPVRNYGQGEIHNREGWDHRNAMDVSLNPSTREGQSLTAYLRENNIPFNAFTGPARSKSGKVASTGPHIHIGMPSHSTQERFVVGTTQDDASQPIPKFEDYAKSQGVQIEIPAPVRRPHSAYNDRAQAAINRPAPRVAPSAPINVPGMGTLQRGAQASPLTSAIQDATEQATRLPRRQLLTVPGANIAAAGKPQTHPVGMGEVQNVNRQDENLKRTLRENMSAAPISSIAPPTAQDQEPAIEAQFVHEKERQAEMDRFAESLTPEERKRIQGFIEEQRGMGGLRSVTEGMQSSAGANTRKAANLLGFLTKGPIGDEAQWISDLRRSGKVAELASLMSQQEDESTGFTRFMKGLGRAAGGAAIDVPLMMGGGVALKGATLPVYGALEGADRGEAISGAVHGYFLHKGMQYTAPLGRLRGALVWTGVPLAMGDDPASALSFGLLAAGGPKRAMVKDGRTIRPAQVADLQAIRSGKLKIVPPIELVEPTDSSATGLSYPTERIRGLATIGERVDPQTRQALESMKGGRNEVTPTSVSEGAGSVGVPAPSPHYERQNRRSRNVATGTKGQFKRGFKEEARPSVEAFHGTRKGFEEVAIPEGNTKSTRGLGAWFAAKSDSLAYEEGNAEYTAEIFAGERPSGEFPEGANVRKVNLDVKNPKEFDGFEDLQESMYGKTAKEFREELQQQGHDGIVVRGSTTDGGQYRDDWVVFDPKQVKGAVASTLKPSTVPPIDEVLLPIRSAVDVKAAMQRHFKLPEEQADAVSRIADARAETWAKQTGNPKEEWYQSRIADITSGGKPAEGALYQEGDSPFYSQLSRVIDQKMPNRASVEQLRAMVESPQSGVKADELKWTGFDDFLNERETVTKQEAQEFLRQNHVEVEEVTKGGARRVEQQGKLWAVLNPDGTVHARLGRQDEARAIAEGTTAPTKFEKWQLPGGENYRELLLTLPVEGKLQNESFETYTQRLYGKSPEEMGDRLRYVAEQHYQETGDMRPDFKNAFRSSHFDEPNVLAHIRFNDRWTSADGTSYTPPQKTLFIEEVQSDWHQKGRGQGYAQGDRAALDQRRVQLEAKRENATSAEKQEWADIKNQLLAFDKGVPDAPFKKTWHELAMKRVLRYAAENGYDKVAWTTGEQQAARYDLSKQVDSIDYVRRKDGNFDISAVGETDEVLRKENIKPSELADLVGKDVAERMAQGVGINRRSTFNGFGEGQQVKSLSGDNLKVGGEGMKGFYDQILPSFMNKYGKKWGARVGQTKVQAKESALADYGVNGADVDANGKQLWGVYKLSAEADPPVKVFKTTQEADAYADKLNADYRGEPAHSVDITPSMKKSVMEGQPLFQGNKASTEFLSDNRAIIRALEKPDVSSAVHEVAHVFRRDLDTSLLQPTERWAGVRNGEWKVENEERFARGFERYLREGKAPTEQLKQVFQQFKEWLSNIYSKIKGSPIEGKLSPEIRDVFDRMLGKEIPTFDQYQKGEENAGLPSGQRGSLSRNQSGQLPRIESEGQIISQAPFREEVVAPQDRASRAETRAQENELLVSRKAAPIRGEPNVLPREAKPIEPQGVVPTQPDATATTRKPTAAQLPIAPRTPVEGVSAAKVEGKPVAPEPRQGETTSARKAQMSADRAELDLPELPATERKGWQKSLDNAKEKGLDAKANTLADEVLAKPRALNDEETAGIVLRVQQVKNEHRVALREVEQAKGDEILQKAAKVEALEREFDKLTEATKKSGSEKGRSLASQKLTINQDYDLISVLQRAKAKSGKELKPEVRQKLEDLTKRLEETEAKLSKSQEENLKLAAQRSVKRMVDENAREQRRTRRATTKEELDTEYAELSTLFKSKLEGRLSANPLDPELVSIIGKIAKNRVRSGITSVEGLVDEIHGKVKDYIDDKRVIRDAISGYGKQTEAREKDPLTVELNRLKSEMRNISKQEDIASGARPNPRLQATKTRLTSQIKDLERRLSEKDFTKSVRQSLEYDRPTKRLQMERDLIKQTVDTQIRLLERQNRPAIVKVLEATTSLRRANLLSAVKTHARNLTSNLAMQGTEEASRGFAAIADRMAARKSGERTTYGANLSEAAKATIKAAITEGPERVKNIMLGREVLPLEGREAARGRESTSSKMQMSKLDTGFKPLDWYVNTIFRSMEAGDAVFKVFAFRRELADIARAQAEREYKTDRSINVRERAKELQQNPTEDMQIEAATYADYATFQNKNKLSSAIAAGKRQVGSIGQFAIESIAPFDRTPTNIIARTFEYSPLGMISAARKYRGFSKAAEKSKVSQSVADSILTRQQQKAFARTFGRASTGTILTTLGLALGAKGLLTGDVDYDEDKGTYAKHQKEAGGGGMLYIPILKKYIYIGDTPAGKAMTTAATIGELITKPSPKSDAAKAKDTTMSRIGSGAKAIGRIALHQPLAEGTSRLLDRPFDEALADYLSSYVPGSAMLRAVNEVADEKPRRIYGQGPAAQFKGTIPGLRSQLPVDERVNPEERGGVGRRLIRAVDPFNTTSPGRGKMIGKRPSTKTLNQ